MMIVRCLRSYSDPMNLGQPFLSLVSSSVKWRQVVESFEQLGIM